MWFEQANILLECSCTCVEQIIRNKTIQTSNDEGILKTLYIW